MVGSRREWVVAASWGAVLVLAAASCSGSATTTTTTAETNSPPTTAPPVVTTTSPPTTITTTTTTVDPLARPEKLVSDFDRSSVDDFDTTGDDLYRIALELADLFNYLEGDPLDDAITIADLLVEKQYPFREQIVGDFRELVDNDWHYADPGIHTVAIEVLQLDGDNATVRIVDERGDQVIVDEEGRAVKTYPGWELDVATFTLRRGTDGRWRYANVGSLTPITLEDLAAMVPVEWTGRTK